MKKITLLRISCPVLCIILFASLAVLSPRRISAQTYKKRTYANFQGIYRTGLYAVGAESVFGNVTNPLLAADNSPQTASTLNIPLGLVGTATVTQFLEFTTNGSHSSVRNIAAGTPVAVKFKLPTSLLGLLDGIEIGTYTGLHTVSQTITGALAFLGTGPGNSAGYNATTRYPMYSGTSLLNALNGAGELELSFTPAQIYNGIYFKLSGNGLSLALTSDLFHAYILEDAPINCSTINDVIDVLSGVQGNSLINAASATGSVTSPWNAVDDDPSLNTYSTMSTGVQVLSSVFETVIFETPSSAGDSVKIVIQDPGAGLLDLSALGGFSIQPFLNNTPVGSPITNIGTLLNLKLLSGGSNKYLLSAAIPVSFDRIQITMGGVAGALQQLRVYDVSRVLTGSSICSVLSLKEKKTPLRNQRSTTASVYVQNPVSGNITMYFLNADKENYKAELRSTDGRLMSSSIINISSQSQKEIMNTPSNLTAGIYLLLLYDQQMQTVKPFKIFIDK